MYLDSNILLARILKEPEGTQGYSDAALKCGGIVIPEVLVEVLAKAEKKQRALAKAKGEEFGKVASSAYRRRLASEILTWCSTGTVVIKDSTVVDALKYMSDMGLNYVDCRLVSLAYSGAGKVATNDKDMRAALGSFLWESTT